MCEHLHYESVYFKELHKERAEYYIQGGAAVVSTITSIPFFEGNCQSETSHTFLATKIFQLAQMYRFIREKGS